MDGQVKRDDVASQVDDNNDLRKETAMDALSGGAGRARSKFRMFREVMKVIISFGQVLSSFAHV